MSNVPAWFIDPNSVKANEFEHGLMLGYMLLPKKGSQSHTTKTSDERKLSDGTILKTWIEVTKEPTLNTNKTAYEMAWGLFQSKTYTDGTVEKVTISEDFTTINITAYIDKDELYNWELGEADENGVITDSYWYRYTLSDNTIRKYLAGFLHWSIQTEV